MRSAQELGIPEEEYREILRRLGREPNALEVELFRAMWSEHCGYKHSRPFLKELAQAASAPWVLQGPGENAGVVEVGEGWAVAFKVESHNHPSAVEPFQGAATGVGGIIRDIVAMGARPIALLDSLRFGPLEHPRTRFLLQGVVGGIAHYGNAIGIPTVGGDLYFHPEYQENPLVNVMCVGLVRKEELRRSRAHLGRTILYAGAPTGRDGIGGAAFASEDLPEETDSRRPNVQVGDPFLGRLLMEATLETIQKGLVEGVQDMGAAGLTSSLVELAHKSGLGLALQLDSVPRREPQMEPWELMLSETQERMVLVAAPGREEELKELFARYGLECAAIAETLAEPVFRIFQGATLWAELPVAALAEAPTYIRPAREDPKRQSLRERTVALSQPSPEQIYQQLLLLLGSPNLSDRTPVFERYDFLVGGDTLLGPGQGDAALLRLPGAHLALAVSLDANPRYARLAPRLGAAHALAEASRNVSVVGARPLAYTDGLNAGNPERPEGSFELREALAGLAEASRLLGVPVVSGNVSLYNEGPEGRIPPTPVVGVVGLIEDRRHIARLGFRRPAQVVVLLGEPLGELGGSEYQAVVYGEEAGMPPALDLIRERAVQEVIRSLIAQGWVTTAHDVAEGGLLVALTEMALPHRIGVVVECRESAWLEALFGEGPSRILFTVEKSQLQQVLSIIEEANLPYRILGETGGDELTVLLPKGRVSWTLEELRSAWRAPLRSVLP
jgi:phosphoribosylformylglycinamidine synthase II